MSLRPTLLLSTCLLAVPGFAFAQAQATVKPDGQFRYALGLAGSRANGNTDAASLALSGDAIRATDDGKLQLNAKLVRSSANGQSNADNLTAFVEQQKDLTPFWFDFARGDFLRDRFANINARGSAYGGIGRHVLRTDTLSFDLSAGLGYTEDRYASATEVNGEQRTRYGRVEGLLAEESNHRLTANTTFRQKLSLYPALRSGGDYRAVFDSSLAVAMNDRFSLNVGFNYRYNNDPGVGVKKYDTLLTTGISIKGD